VDHRHAAGQIGSDAYFVQDHVPEPSPLIVVTSSRETGWVGRTFLRSGAAALVVPLITLPNEGEDNPAAILAPYTESLLAPGKVTLAWIRWPIGCPGPAPNRQDHQQKGNDNQCSVQEHGLTHHVRGWLGPGPELPNRAVPVVPAPPNCDRTAPPLWQSGSGVLSW
jgi:hypothetical protein